MFERILVPIDGSEGANAALRVALEIQRRFRAEVYLLCVYPHYSSLEASMSLAQPEKSETPDDTMRQHASRIVETAKNFARDLGAAEVRGFVKCGPPARTIVAFAKEKKIELIVLGSRGLGGIESFLLGSVSHKVTSLAKCPVMVV